MAQHLSFPIQASTQSKVTYISSPDFAVNTVLVQVDFSAPAARRQPGAGRTLARLAWVARAPRAS